MSCEKHENENENKNLVFFFFLNYASRRERRILERSD